MENNLEFLATYTVEEYKTNKGISAINIVKSPNTGKLFMATEAGRSLGAVSSKGIPTNPLISLVKGEPTSENPSGEFYLMHEASNSNVMATF